MTYSTKLASPNTYRYKKNQGFQNHKNYFDQLKSYQDFREANQDYSINKVQPPAGYQEVFVDDFSGNSLDSSKWGTGVQWGSFHKDPGLHGFYFPENGDGPTTNSIRVENGILKLDCKYDPKQFDVNNLTGRDAWRKENLLNYPSGYYQENPQFTIDYNGGSVFSKETFKKGWFEIELKVPINKYLWTGIWLHGVQFWPPEIDIVEHFSFDDDHEISYDPNIHFGGDNPNSPQYGTDVRGWYRPDLEYNFHMFKPDRMKLWAGPYRFTQYVCHWTDDFVRIYYDGILYREYNAELLHPLYRDGNIDMRIILNNGVGNDYSKGNPFGDDHPYENSTLYINKVRVLQE